MESGTAVSSKRVHGWERPSGSDFSADLLDTQDAETRESFFITASTREYGWKSLKIGLELHDIHGKIYRLQDPTATGGPSHRQQHKLRDTTAVWKVTKNNKEKDHWNQPSTPYSLRNSTAIKVIRKGSRLPPFLSIRRRWRKCWFHAPTAHKLLRPVTLWRTGFRRKFCFQ